MHLLYLLAPPPPIVSLSPLTLPPTDSLLINLVFFPLFPTSALSSFLSPSLPSLCYIPFVSLSSSPPSVLHFSLPPSHCPHFPCTTSLLPFYPFLHSFLLPILPLFTLHWFHFQTIFLFFSPLFLSHSTFFTYSPLVSSTFYYLSTIYLPII